MVKDRIMRYPNRIREYREARGWSQSKLAEAANTSYQQISRLELGDRRLSQEWLERLARAFGGGMQPSDLLPEHGSGNFPLMVWAPIIAWGEVARAKEVVSLSRTDDKEHVAVPYPRTSIAAVRAQADDMNRRVPAGGVMVFDYDDNELRDGRFYIISIEGRTFARRYRASPARFEPYSTEPDHPTFFPDGDAVAIHGRIIWFLTEA